MFDEVQYLPKWEIHLKSLVDSYPAYQFIAIGSAAAVLKLKSKESAAGRFTDFLLPPFTFSEYLAFIKKEDVRES
jgi:predicted AAA+ superfamily ATPase